MLQKVKKISRGQAGYLEKRLFVFPAAPVLGRSATYNRTECLGKFAGILIPQFQSNFSNLEICLQKTLGRTVHFIAAQIGVGSLPIDLLEPGFQLRQTDFMFRRKLFQTDPSVLILEHMIFHLFDLFCQRLGQITAVFLKNSLVGLNVIEQLQQF